MAPSAEPSPSSALHRGEAACRGAGDAFWEVTPVPGWGMRGGRQAPRRPAASRCLGERMPTHLIAAVEMVLLRQLAQNLFSVEKWGFWPSWTICPVTRLGRQGVFLEKRGKKMLCSSRDAQVVRTALLPAPLCPRRALGDTTGHPTPLLPSLVQVAPGRAVPLWPPLPRVAQGQTVLLLD